jgi:hypothetical protein
MEPKRRSSSNWPQYESGERPLPPASDKEPKRTVSGEHRFEQRLPTVQMPAAPFPGIPAPSPARTPADSFPPSIIPQPPDTEGEEIIADFDVEGFVSAEPSTIPPPPEALYGQAREQHIADMRALFAQGLVDKALEIAEGLLEADPFDTYAREYVTTCLVRLLGPRGLARVPVLRVHGSDLASLPLDPRAAFVLMHVDGVSTIEMITEVCAMPEHEALRLIVTMRDLGVISLE